MSARNFRAFWSDSPLVTCKSRTTRLVEAIVCSKPHKYKDLCYDLTPLSYNELAAGPQFASRNRVGGLANVGLFANSGATCRRLSRSRTPRMSNIYSRIVGTGSYLPSRIVTNDELASTLDTSDAWIRTMTGIVQRRIAGEGESTAEMAAIASARALGNAGVNARDIDLIIVATITPDLVFPSTAALLQARLGARNVGAFDLSAACSGFMYGLALADGMIASGRLKTALVVGAETMSRLLDWKDRSTCVLFGDGAAAVVLVSAKNPGVRSVRMHADGSDPNVLCTPSQRSRYLHMDGGAVFRFAVRGLVEAGGEMLEANNITAASVDWLIPHQANLRIIESCARKLSIAKEKVVVTVDRHANTSAASIPLALDAAVTDGRVRTGDSVLLLSVGGGFTWAGGLITWA